MVMAKMSLYDCLWVSPATASSVITAPLCGSVSMPPLAIDGDAVEHFQRNAGRIGVGDEGVGHRRQRDAHAARTRIR